MAHRGWTDAEVLVSSFPVISLPRPAVRWHSLTSGSPTRIHDKPSVTPSPPGDRSPSAPPAPTSSEHSSWPPKQRATPDPGAPTAESRDRRLSFGCPPRRKPELDGTY